MDLQWISTMQKLPGWSKMPLVAPLAFNNHTSTLLRLFDCLMVVLTSQIT